MTSVPPFETPPPPVCSPPVALLLLMTLLLTVMKLPGPPPLPLPLAMPPPPEPVLWSIVLLLMVRTPAMLTMPPPPMPVDGTVLKLTTLLFSVSVAPGPMPIVPLAMPPPAPDAKLFVTTLWLRTSVPIKLRMPPPNPAGPSPEAFPPVIVTPLSLRLPPAPPLIVMMRKLPLAPFVPAIVLPAPLIVIGVVITGKPLAPRPGIVLLADVSEYVQPGARLMQPPPLAFAAATAATRPAAPPPGPEQGTLPDPAAIVAAPPSTARAAHEAAVAPTTNLHRLPLPIRDLLPSVRRITHRDPGARLRHAARPDNACGQVWSAARVGLEPADHRGVPRERRARRPRVRRPAPAPAPPRREERHRARQSARLPAPGRRFGRGLRVRRRLAEEPGLVLQPAREPGRDGRDRYRHSSHARARRRCSGAGADLGAPEAGPTDIRGLRGEDARDPRDPDRRPRARVSAVARLHAHLRPAMALLDDEGRGHALLRIWDCPFVLCAGERALAIRTIALVHESALK